MNWQGELSRLTKGRLRFREPLAGHSTLGIGGRIQAWLQPKDTDDLRQVLLFARKKKLPVYIVGNGSNILFKDGLIKGLILQLSCDYFKRIEFFKNRLKCGSAVSLNRLIEEAQQKNLGGCEYLFGIPGTLGGALVMNAGVSLNSRTQDIGSLVREVEVMDYAGNIRILGRQVLRFTYRQSNLDRFIILAATLELKKCPNKQIEAKILQIRRLRAAVYGKALLSCGCMFKNPRKGLSAGYLIETSGLGGVRVGNAQVYWRHANFIVNKGKARASSVIRLMDLIKHRARKRFGITLESEVKVIG